MRASESNSPAFYWDAKKHSHRLTYLAFDLLYLDGYDLRGASLIERKHALKDVLAQAPPTLASAEYFDAHEGKTVYHLQNGAGRHRLQAAGLPLSLRPAGDLDRSSGCLREGSGSV